MSLETLAHHRLLIVALFGALPLTCIVTSDTRAEASQKHRLIVLSDMGNEPDEEQQRVHTLPHCNEFDLEAQISVTGKFLKKGPRPGLFHTLEG